MDPEHRSVLNNGAERPIAVAFASALMILLVTIGCAPRPKPAPKEPVVMRQPTGQPSTSETSNEPHEPILGPVEAKELSYRLGRLAKAGRLVAHRSDVSRAILLLLHGEEGIDEWLMEQADTYARMGYIVVIPDLSDTSKGGRDLTVPLNIDEAIEAAVDDLDISPEAPRVGAIGYGSGGSHALTHAEERDLEMIVMVGGQLRASEEALLNVREPVLGIFGANDPDASMELVEQFREAMRRTGGQSNLQVWSDEGAGFIHEPNDPANVAEARVEIVRWLDSYLPVQPR